jgi:predicted nucleotide-binding protein (sugar kinase/HSP70/actin superfamily)
VTLGTQHSPEFACLPLKINLGNYREALESGAEVIIMAGGSGPCRFGYYAQVQREILKELGLEFEMLVLEAPQGHLADLLRQIKRLVPDFSWRKLIYALRVAWAKILAIDEVEHALQYARPREAKTGAADQRFVRFLDAVDVASDL